MIDSFALNRDDLTHERVRLITQLYVAFRARALPGLAQHARSALDTTPSASEPHTNCARCYVRLLEENPAGAAELFEAALKALDRDA